MAEHTSYLSNRMNNLRRQTEMFVFKSTMKLRNYCMCSCTWICNKVKKMITCQFLQFVRCFAASVAYIQYFTIHILYSIVQQWFYISQPPWLDPPPPLASISVGNHVPATQRIDRLRERGGAFVTVLTDGRGRGGEDHRRRLQKTLVLFL